MNKRQRDKRIHSSKDHRIVYGHCYHSCESQHSKYIVCDIDGSTHSKLDFTPCNNFCESNSDWRKKKVII